MARKRKPENERWAAYLAGELSVRDMDDEELEHGRFRNKAGLFTGRPPGNVPRGFEAECARELHLRTDTEFRKDLLEIIREQKRLALEAEREDVRMKAGQYVIERVKGKVPEHVTIHAGEPEWWSEVDKLLEEMEPEQLALASRILGRSQTTLNRADSPATSTSSDYWARSRDAEHEVVDVDVVEDDDNEDDAQKMAELVDEDRLTGLFR